MKNLEIYFKKISRRNYAVSGKSKPCSSKSKIMAYVKREFDKMGIEAGRITIEGEDKDVRDKG